MTNKIYQDVEVKGNVKATSIDSVGIAYYGTCTTSSSTTAKAVTKAGFVLSIGSVITVKFTNANTVSSPTLNVNGTGAKAIKCQTRTSGLVWKSGEMITFVYDGTNWCVTGGYSLWDKPVNTRYIQYNGESTPATLFGGTWTADTDYTGKTLVGSGTDFTLGATGGSADAVVVEHAHNAIITLGAYGINPDGFTPQRGYNEGTGIELQDRVEVKPTGESGTGKNMPPYKVVTVWKRTA